jgi:cell division protease FtsH
LLKDANPLDKVTIIPRSGGTLGFTLPVPNEEMGLETRSELLAMITVALGGRAAEEIVFGESEIDIGAGSDLQKVAQIARLMVTKLGMSSLGLAAFESSNNEFSWMQRPDYSEDIASRIDRQIREMVMQCHEQAKSIIFENRDLCDRLVDVLLEVETMDGEEFRKIVTEFTTVPEKTREPIKF